MPSHSRSSGRPCVKGFDWNVMNRLHARGYISDPRSKTKSVVFTEDGLGRSVPTIVDDRQSSISDTLPIRVMREAEDGGTIAV